MGGLSEGDIGHLNDSVDLMGANCRGAGAPCWLQL